MIVLRIAALASTVAAVLSDCYCTGGVYACSGSTSDLEVSEPACRPMRNAVFKTSDPSLCGLCNAMAWYKDVPVTVDTDQCTCLQPCCSLLSGCACEGVLTLSSLSYFFAHLLKSCSIELRQVFQHSELLFELKTGVESK